MQAYELTVNQACEKMRKGELSSEELTRSVLGCTEKRELAINAYRHLDPDRAIKKAKEVDDLRAKGQALSPMAGIPIAVKDNLCTKDMPTTCSSNILASFKPPYDATVVKKLREQHAVILGKANLDEFAMGSSTENSAFAVTKNPWDIRRVPGGSSGGSAAAVAAREALCALGSDTGGSIRQPASLCGIVGMKPTYGTVSRYGLVAFASSLDQIGPLTRSVPDCAILLDAVTGHDPKDSTSVERDYESYFSGLSENIKGKVIGIPAEMDGKGLAPDIVKQIEGAKTKLKNCGAVFKTIHLPTSEYALAAYYLIACAEASSNLARYDGVKYGVRAKDYDDLIDLYARSRSEGFGDEVKRRIILGTYALSSGYYDAYYLKAQKVRTLIVREYEQAFASCDAILTPTSPTTAFTIGEKTDDPLSMYLSDIYTVPVNIAGLPALSMPCGLDDSGLPVGVQLIGPAFGEQAILNIAYAYEKIGGFPDEKPAGWEVA